MVRPEVKAKDSRIKDYTYALGQTLEEIVRVLMVITSGYTTTWVESRDRVDPAIVELMTNELPPVITAQLFDDEARADSKIGEVELKATSSSIFGARARSDSPSSPKRARPDPQSAPKRPEQPHANTPRADTPRADTPRAATLARDEPPPPPQAAYYNAPPPPPYYPLPPMHAAYVHAAPTYPHYQHAPSSANAPHYHHQDASVNHYHASHYGAYAPPTPPLPPPPPVPSLYYANGNWTLLYPPRG